MQSTMNLLSEAEKVKDLSAWAEEIGLSKRVLYTSKYREHLSPAVAGALAEKLGLDAKEWIVIAALESERDSACKSRMVRKFITGAALAGTLMGTAGGATAAVATQALVESQSVYYVKSHLGQAWQQKQEVGEVNRCTNLREIFVQLQFALSFVFLAADD